MVPFESKVESAIQSPASLRAKKLLDSRRHPSDSDTDAGSSSSSLTSLYIEDDYPLPIEKVDLDIFLQQDDNDVDSKEHRPTSEGEKSRQELEYWKASVEHLQANSESSSIRTAEALMNLGNAQLACKDFLESGKTYLAALKIYQMQGGNLNLAVARALDKVGLAASMTHQHLDLALTALSEALTMRCEVLGPEHVDSIDSLNNVAGVRLNRGEFKVAAENYQEVLQYRQNIFGNHACVATTASILASIECERLHNIDSARGHFRLTRDILQEIGQSQSPYYLEAILKLEELESMEEI